MKNISFEEKIDAVLKVMRHVFNSGYGISTEGDPKNLKPDDLVEIYFTGAAEFEDEEYGISNLAKLYDITDKQAKYLQDSNLIDLTLWFNFKGKDISDIDSIPNEDFFSKADLYVGMDINDDEISNAFYPENKDDLKKIIDTMIRLRGPKVNLNLIHVDKIEDMSYLFCESDFNGNISKWDVSNVKNMEGMFAQSAFNNDISKWNVSNVKNMDFMFLGASQFNQDISSWNVSNVRDMYQMFSGALPEDKWIVGDVVDMSFNQDLSNWDVRNVTDMRMMFFENNSFNQNLSKWKINPDCNFEDFKNISSVLTDNNLPADIKKHNQEIIITQNKEQKSRGR